MVDKNDSFLYIIWMVGIEIEVLYNEIEIEVQCKKTTIWAKVKIVHGSDKWYHIGW